MILNDFFDKIYVINLKDSIDRKNHIINEFKRMNITEYEFFEAVHFNDNSVKNLLNSDKVLSFPPCFRCLKNRCGCENNFLTKFQIANWCSYIKLFNNILKSDDNLILICEDDIVFSKNSTFILNNLLSNYSMKKYNIDFNKPLLIKMGAAYDRNTHNIWSNPTYIKNYSLSNPCFAVNKEMIKIFLYNLKVIDYHSDIYFHKKIPSFFNNIQMLVMNPFPVYELSFVNDIKKFNSLVRPNNEIRRKEYKDFLFITINKLLEYIPIQYCNILNMDVSNKKIGFNGTINYWYLIDEFNKQRFYFKNNIFIYDNIEDDIKIIYNDIQFNKNYYLLKIINDVITKYDIKCEKNTESILLNLNIIYPKILSYFEDNNFMIININEPNIFSKHKIIEQYFNIKNTIHKSNIINKTS